MKPKLPKEFSRLHWIFMYSIWILAELTSIAIVLYSIYSVIILLFGNWAGAAVFAGVAPGFILSLASLYIYMSTRIPWRAGDYQVYLPCADYQVRQVRLFHTILWSDEEAEVAPHMETGLDLLEPEGEKNGHLVYTYNGVTGYEFYERWRWLAYAWAILCEIFVFAVLFLSVWFMAWAGIEASVSFLSGTLLPSVGVGIFCNYQLRMEPKDGVHVAGLTWVVIEDYGTLNLRHFILYILLKPSCCEPYQEQAETKREAGEVV